MADLELSFRPPSELKPYAGNARTHPKSQISEIAASIQAGTFAQPILVDEQGVIIAGHGRLLAANQLQMAQVPVIQISGLSEVQKRALRLADNKIAQKAGWDIDLVRIELEAIQLEGFDIEITGFSTGEFDLLVSGGDVRWRRKFGQLAKVGSTSMKDGLYDWEAEAVLG